MDLSAKNSLKKIFLVAGEASADFHAANLVRKIRAKLSENDALNFSAVGGANLKKEQVNIIYDNQNLAAIGPFSAILKLPIYGKLARKIIKFIKEERPNLVILIDFAGFNLRLAKLIKKFCPTRILYYITPQVWASRAYRVKTLKKYVDEICVIFPFEKEFYETRHCPVSFVGHPLLETVKTTKSKKEICEQYHLDNQKKIIGLFPGSRPSELLNLLPVLLETAALLQRKITCEFVLPLAQSFTLKAIEPFQNQLKKLNVKIIPDDIYNLISVCDAIAAASGTVTLEIALLEIPLTVIYKIKPFWLNIKKFIKVPFICLCNLIMKKEVVKEFLQNDANKDNITAEVLKILTNAPYNHEMRHNLALIKKNLDVANTDDIATIVLKNLTL